MAGVWKGLRLTEYTKVTGGAKNDLYGFKVTLTGLEEFQAAFMSSVEIPDITTDNVLLLEDLTAILLEDTTELLLE